MKDNARENSDYQLRIFDQSNNTNKVVYVSIDKEDFNKIVKILEIKEEDWC